MVRRSFLLQFYLGKYFSNISSVAILLSLLCALGHSDEADCSSVRFGMEAPLRYRRGLSACWFRREIS